MEVKRRGRRRVGSFMVRLDFCEVPLGVGSEVLVDCEPSGLYTGAWLGHPVWGMSVRLRRVGVGFSTLGRRWMGRVAMSAAPAADIHRSGPIQRETPRGSLGRLRKNESRRVGRCAGQTSGIGTECLYAQE
jgi:hypothetical protein